MQVKNRKTVAYIGLAKCGVSGKYKASFWEVAKAVHIRIFCKFTNSGTA